jgi:uncharacterized membrane protein
MASENNQRTLLQKLTRFIATTVLGGVVVVLPAVILFLLVRLVFLTIVPVLQPIGYLFELQDYVQKWMVDILSLAFVIIGFFLLGLMVRTRLGSRFFDRIEQQYLYKLPLYSILRETIRQFSGSGKTPFSQVVLVDVFNNSVRMIGFITEELANDELAVFVPTGPNPTNGFIFILPRNRVELVNIRTEDAMRIVVGLGVGMGSVIRKPDQV